MTNDELLHKWVEGTISEEELNTFKSRPEYPSLVELYKNTENFSAPVFDQEKVLANILSQPKSTVKTEKTGRRIFLKNWMVYAVAASVALLVGYFLWPHAGEPVNLITYQMAAGESMEALLPDESIFYLNAGSELSYDENNWNNERTLSLRGEAFFEVQEGSTFTVKTPNGDVQVLGTEFNVISRRKTLEVKCKSGKVAVLNSRGKKIGELTANKGLRITDDNLIKNLEVSTNDIASWREGVSKFDDVPLWVVLKELQIQFDIDIIKGNVNTEEIINCNFQHEDLELALKTVLGPLDIKYKIEGNQVELSK